MLQHWHEFYPLLGTAAATLVALLFVADAADIPDRLGYGLIPAVSYLGWIAAALFIWRNAEFGPDILAVAAVALLLTNIRNAWDLMLSLARRTTENARVYDQAPR